MKILSFNENSSLLILLLSCVFFLFVFNIYLIYFCIILVHIWIYIKCYIYLLSHKPIHSFILQIHISTVKLRLHEMPGQFSHLVYCSSTGKLLKQMLIQTRNCIPQKIQTRNNVWKVSRPIEKFLLSSVQTSACFFYTLHATNTKNMSQAIQGNHIDIWASACRKVEVAEARCKGRIRKTWKECVDDEWWHESAWFTSWMDSIQGCVEGPHMGKRLTLV